MTGTEVTNAPRLPIAVFDTGVVLAGAFNPSGVCSKVLRLMEREEITVFVSHRVRSEYEKLLHQDELKKRFPFLNDEYIALQLDRFDVYAERIPNPPQVMAYARDPKDEPFINLILAVKADYLVTLDNDLLDLPAYPDFAKQPHQPRIVRPGAFLDDMESRRALLLGQRAVP